MLQRVVVCIKLAHALPLSYYIVVCCSVLQRVVAFRSVLQRIAARYSVLQRISALCSV